MESLDYIMHLGSPVLMPITFIILGLIVRIPFRDAFKSGLMVGIGFIGLSITVEFMIESLTPITIIIVEKFNLSLTVLDIGWPAAAAIAMGTKIGIFIVPLCIFINIVMLYTRTTRVLNVDIWNLWHNAVTGSLVAFMSSSFSLGLFAAAINCILTMIIADRTAKDVSNTLGLTNVSIPHGFAVSFVPIAWLVNYIFDRTPIIRGIKINIYTLQGKFSILNDPGTLGAIIGALLALSAGADIKTILNTAMTMAAVMLIIPRMAKILMEGVYPISKQIQTLVQTRLTYFNSITIGLDAAVSVGHPVTLTISLFMIPVILFLAAIVPGNQFLPFASLTGLPFAFVLVTAVCRGDVFRTLITAIITLTTSLYFATNLAPLMTSVAKSNHFTIPDNVTLISSIDYAGALLPWGIIRMFGSNIIAILAVTIGTLTLMYINYRLLQKEDIDYKK